MSETLPKTIAEAVQILIAKLPPEYLEHIAVASEDALAEYHLTLGMTIRNDFGLWCENQDLLQTIGYGAEADDASAAIIHALWEDLQRRRTRH